MEGRQAINRKGDATLWETTPCKPDENIPIWRLWNLESAPLKVATLIE
jgi:hypothetical protein